MNPFRRWALCLLALLLFFPELWVGDEPLILSYRGKIFFPVIETHVGQDFGQEGLALTDYKVLGPQSVDFVLWPAISWGKNETDFNLPSVPAPPSPEHWLGTDDRGRDMLARMAYGLRTSLWFALLSVAALSLVGLLLAFVFSELQWRDGLEFLANVVESVPQFLLFLVLASAWSAGPLSLGFLFVLFNLPTVSLLLFSKVQSLGTEDFVAAAKALGASRPRQWTHHMMPHLMGVLLALAPKLMAQLIMVQVSLGFLGFGFPAPVADLGEVLAQSEMYLGQHWWLVVWPCAVVFALVAVLTMISNRLVRFNSKII